MCDGLVRDSILLIVGGAVALAIIIAAIAWAYKTRMPQDRKDQLASARRVFTLHIKLKIAIGFYQIVTKVDEGARRSASRRSPTLQGWRACI
jgi:undecaprenyl pyrophosphate phosphatase UppP